MKDNQMSKKQKKVEKKKAAEEEKDYRIQMIMPHTAKEQKFSKDGTPQSSLS